MAAPTSRTAIVTGANKGIGFAVIRKIALNYPSSAFSKNGTLPLLIYLAARDQGRAEAAVKDLYEDATLKKAKALASDGGLSTIKFAYLDISKPDSITAFGKQIEKEHPDGIDVLVNNAGIAEQGFNPEMVRTTLGANYDGTLLATQTFLPLLRQGGRLVNVASMAGVLDSKYSSAIRSQFSSARTVPEITKLMDGFSSSVTKGTHQQDGWPTGAAYSVSKCGVIGFSRIIAAEEKAKNRDVLVNVCCPGYVDTDMTKHKGVKTPDEGAETPALLAIGDIKGVSGEYWQDEIVKKWEH